MAYMVNNQLVVDNSRNLANITTFDSTVTSIWDTVTSTATGKTLVNREYCFISASGQTINLPTSPSAGWQVAISVGNFTSTVVGRNGQNIMGLAENLTIDIQNITLTFLYVNASQGWRIL